MSEKVNLKNVAATCRPNLKVLGGTLGTQFFQPEIRAAILDFEKRKLEVERNGNKDIILNRTPRRFRVVGHEILGVNLVHSPLGEAKVVLNKDTDEEVSIAIATDGNTFSNVTEDALGKALHGDKSIIFADAKKLVEQINILNYDEKERLIKLREEINKSISQIDSSINENNKKIDEYYKQLLAGSNPNEDPSKVVINVMGNGSQPNKDVVIVED